MFNNEFPPLGGGTGTVNLELFKQFKKYPNLKIDLITSAPGKKKEVEQFSENIRIIKLPVYKKEIHHASNFELILYAVKASFMAFKLNKNEEYNFVFIWTTVPAGLPAILLKLFKKTPYILRIGGTDIPGFEKRYSFIYKIISPFIKFVWKKADFIIAKCKEEKKMITDINKKLIVNIISNGIDVKKFYPKPRKINETMKIICSARLIKRKGQYTLMDAITNLKKQNILIKTDFVGEGNEKNNYIAYAEKNKINELITFSGYVPRENMAKKYQDADIFVLPSYNEGMSNALLEAMACGLPAIVTNVGGTEELINEKNGFVFSAGNAEELTAILKQIYDNKNIILSFGENSRKTAEQFNWENIANEYLSLFKNIITKSKLRN